jgi:hypothetical protein
MPKCVAPRYAVRIFDFNSGEFAQFLVPYLSDVHGGLHPRLQVMTKSKLDNLCHYPRDEDGRVVWRCRATDRGKRKYHWLHVRLLDRRAKLEGGLAYEMTPDGSMLMR